MALSFNRGLTVYAANAKAAAPSPGEFRPKLLLANLPKNRFNRVPLLAAAS
jgi:hypothetical protein